MERKRNKSSSKQSVLPSDSIKCEDEHSASFQDKHKRRSKSDNQGRDYICGCGKRYLSHPALYTHIKTNHSGITPKGTNIPASDTIKPNSKSRKVSDNYKHRMT